MLSSEKMENRNITVVKCCVVTSEILFEDDKKLMENQPIEQTIPSFSKLSLKMSNFFKDSFPRDIDIIFCRNVMIYFDKMHQKELVKKFYDSILDHGYLFIGHSETLHSISDDFNYIKILDSPVYTPKARG